MNNRDMPSGTNASIGKMVDGVEMFSASEGLTKREYAAIAAMNGLLTSINGEATDGQIEILPKVAVDRLFNELERAE